MYIGNVALLKTCLLECYAVSTGVYFPKCSKKRSSFFFRVISKRKVFLDRLTAKIKVLQTFDMSVNVHQLTRLESSGIAQVYET
jgi:hypothetical protein